MPVLKDARSVKKVQLKSLEGAEVEIYNTFNMGDVEKVQLKGQPEQHPCYALTFLIKSWNLTLEDGKSPAPITEESIQKLAATDVALLMKAVDIGDFLAEAAKKD